MSVNLSITSILETYPAGDVEFWYDLHYMSEGDLKVLIVKNERCSYDVWNIHPLRKGWQLVYTLERCDPYKQLHESIASLKRLYEI